MAGEGGGGVIGRVEMAEGEGVEMLGYFGGGRAVRCFEEVEHFDFYLGLLSRARGIGGLIAWL